MGKWAAAPLRGLLAATKPAAPHRQPRVPSLAGRRRPHPAALLRLGAWPLLQAWPAYPAVSRLLPTLGDLLIFHCNAPPPPARLTRMRASDQATLPARAASADLALRSAWLPRSACARRFFPGPPSTHALSSRADLPFQRLEGRISSSACAKARKPRGAAPRVPAQQPLLFGFRGFRELAPPLNIGAGGGRLLSRRARTARGGGSE